MSSFLNQGETVADLLESYISDNGIGEKAEDIMALMGLSGLELAEEYATSNLSGSVICDETELHEDFERYFGQLEALTQLEIREDGPMFRELVANYIDGLERYGWLHKFQAAEYDIDQDEFFRDYTIKYQR